MPSTNPKQKLVSLAYYTFWLFVVSRLLSDSRNADHKLLQAITLSTKSVLNPGCSSLLSPKDSVVLSKHRFSKSSANPIVRVQWRVNHGISPGEYDRKIFDVSIVGLAPFRAFW